MCKRRNEGIAIIPQCLSQVMFCLLSPHSLTCESQSLVSLLLGEVIISGHSLTPRLLPCTIPQVVLHHGLVVPLEDALPGVELLYAGILLPKLLGKLEEVILGHSQDNHGRENQGNLGTLAPVISMQM